MRVRQLAIGFAVLAAGLYLVVAFRPVTAGSIPQLDKAAPDAEMTALESRVKADASDAHAIRMLARRYAEAIVEGSAIGLRAEAVLESTSNVWILGNAAHDLQLFHHRRTAEGKPDPRLAALAERCLGRAHMLDPSLDRRAILPPPPPPPKPNRPLTLAEIPMIEPGAFPGLPAGVVRVLQAKGCRVPQPPPEPYEKATGPFNVIRGEFFAAGESGWAALCIIGKVSVIVAFRNDNDEQPAMLNEQEAESRVGSEQEPGYFRAIGAVGRDFIMKHHRAYGGPKPPPIDHHGIDDYFVGKASATMYYHEGKWLSLQGAD